MNTAKFEACTHCRMDHDTDARAITCEDCGGCAFGPQGSDACDHSALVADQMDEAVAT